MTDLETLLDTLVLQRISSKIADAEKMKVVQSVKEDFLNFLFDAYVQSQSRSGGCGGCSGGSCCDKGE